MKKSLWLFLILFYSNIFSQSVNEFFNTNGKDILTPEGKPIFLKGINLGNWLLPEGYMFKFEHASSPRQIKQVIAELIGPDDAAVFWKKYYDNYITIDDIKFIKSLGMNSIRVPFDYRILTPEEFPGMWLETGFKLLDKVIDWCEQENLYVILDMHGAPGGQTGDNIDNSWGYPWLFVNSESQKRTVELWMKIAERYKDKDIIIGYDLLNEPIAHYFGKENLNSKLEPLYKEITAAIREVDTNHIIILGGAQWNTNFKVFGDPFDSKLIYNFHKYWCDTTQEQIQEYVDFRDKYNVPIWMSESGENADEWVGGWRRLLEKNNIGWCFWPYKKMDALSCPVQFPKPEGYDVIINYANTSRESYEKIRELRPDINIVKKALNDFLENSKFSNCSGNDGYIKALGLK